MRAPEAGVGTILSEDRSADRCHCSFPELSSHPAGPAQEGTKSALSINLVNIVHPLGDSFRSSCTQLTHPPKLPPAAPAQEWPTLAHAAASLKRLRTPPCGGCTRLMLRLLIGPQTSHKQWLASVYIVTHTKPHLAQYKRQPI